MPSVRVGDRQVGTSEPLIDCLSLTAKQHGHSLRAVMGNRHTPHRAHVAEADLAILHELPNVRQGQV